MPLYQSKNRPKILITMGDPAGIGPEVVLKALASPRIKGLADFFVMGDEFVLDLAGETCGLSASRRSFTLINLNNVPRAAFKFGKASRLCAGAAVEYIERAAALVGDNAVDALVTAPINKESAKLAGFDFPGHTEFLAYLSGVKDFCMMLAGGAIRVALATTHIGIADVSRRLRAGDVKKAIILTAGALKRYFKIKNPRIAVCGLNPHAGEGGFFGREEQKIIAPAVKAAAKKAKGARIYGPLPSDTVFYDALNGKYDAEIAMYHDQGLIPLKMLAKDTAVNVTLGLPFVRTSPAHGTALDIAGKNLANPCSMIEAIKLAVKLA